MAEQRTCPDIAAERSNAISNDATNLSGINPVNFEGGNVPALTAAQAVHDRLVELLNTKGDVSSRIADYIWEIHSAIDLADRTNASVITGSEVSM